MATRIISICTRALGALLAAWSLQAAAIPHIDLEPETLSVSPGQIFGVNVVIHDAADLFAFQFDLGFTPGLLAANSVNEGPLLATSGPAIFVPGAIDNAAGQILFTLGTLTDNLPGVNGTGELARLVFQAGDSSGIATLTLSNIILLDSTLSDIAYDALLSAPIAVVPEPGTAALLAPMLMGMAWALRSRRPTD